MKIKLMPMLAGLLMFAVALAPLSAQACSENKNTDNSGTTTQPTNPPQT